MLRCRECGQEKPVHQFAEDRRYSTGRRNVCHDCDPHYRIGQRRYERPVSGMSRCSDCGETKPVAAFASNAVSAPVPARGRLGGLYPKCRECQSEYWSRHRLHTTKEEDDAMWGAQRGLCYLCEEPLASPDDEDRKLRAVRDHREVDGRKIVLGWAHSACNICLGGLDDDPVKALKVALNAARAESESGLLCAATRDKMRALAAEWLAERQVAPATSKMEREPPPG